MTIKPIYLFCLLLCSFNTLAQYNYFADTIYYDKQWNEVERAKAHYFRPPPQLGGDLFAVRYYLANAPGSLVTEGFHNRGKREGKWTFYIDSTDKLSSTALYHNGIKEGETLVYDEQTGELRRQENYVKGQLHGRWRAYSGNQVLTIEGYLKKDLPVGDWKYYYTDGGLKGIITYDSLGKIKQTAEYDSLTHKKTIETDGKYGTKRNGVYKYYYHNSDLLDYTVTYKDDIMEGPTRTYDSLTQALRSEGMYRNNEMEGEWRFYTTGGAVYMVQHYKAGLYDGHFLLKDTVTGNIKAEGDFDNDSKDGKWTYYFAGGEVSSIENYKNGKAHGAYYKYDTLTHQLVEEGTFKNNKRTGDWKFYYPDGKRIRYTESYRNDEPDGYAAGYHEDGTRSLEMHFDHGRKNGLTSYYYDDGRLWIRLNYKDDLLDGKMETFYPNGRPKREDIYNMGELQSGRCLNEMGEETDYYAFYQEAAFREDVMTYIGNHLQYPEEAKQKQVEGKVVVRFTIRKDGTLDDIETIERVGAGCDEEAIRLIANMPVWTPMYIDGEPFETQKTLPIVFWLR